uniref:Uncharacterized protein n=1 Tax=Arundo donax TaxID=35708 RepID=A0A0A9HRM8_ARUDO
MPPFLCISREKVSGELEKIYIPVLMRH